MFLRATTTATNSTMLDYIMGNQTKYNELSAQASAQKKLLTPSDNPTDAISVLNINKNLSQINGYIDNMTQAGNELNVLDNSLSSITKSLQRAHDLAVQAADGTNSTNSLGNIKIEIDQMIQSLKGIGNTRYNGSYIFAGNNVGTVPFVDSANGGISYIGTPENKDYERYIQISEGVDTAINIPGDELLGSYDPGTVGPPVVAPTGSGILKTLYEFSNALATVPIDYNVIRPSMDAIKNNIQDISNLRTNFGSITNRFEMTKTSLDANVIQLKSFKSDLEDLDLAEALTNLANQELALKATMAVATKTLQSASLLDYM